MYGGERLCDYFVVVGFGPDPQPLDPPKPQEGVRIKEKPVKVAKPQGWMDRAYKGDILDRFPLQDYKGLTFPPGLELFCIPDGLHLYDKPNLPKIHNFACTIANGDRLYGVCLTFFEEVGPELLAKLKSFDQKPDGAAEGSAPQTPPKPGEPGAPAGSPSSPMTPSPGQPQLQLANGNGAKPGDGAAAAGQPVLTIAVSPPPDAGRASAASQPPQQQQQPGAGGLPGGPKLSVSTGAAVRSPSSDSLATPGPSSAGGGRRRSRPQTVSTEGAVYAPKCLGVLSHFPFLKHFRTFLTEMYRLSLTPCKMPIERLLCNFMTEVPLPPAGKMRVQYTIADKTVMFARPPPNDPLQFSHVPVRHLFRSIDHDKLVTLLECALTEQRILLLSTQMSALTTAAETLLCLMYPFKWPHVYIPLLPMALVDYIHAPMPYIIGTHPTYVADETLDPEIVVVDLDTNKVTTPPNMLQLPAHERKKLLKQLKACSFQAVPARMSSYERKVLENQDLAFHFAPAPEEVDAEMKKGDDEVKEEAELRHWFFRVFVSIFKGYRDYLIFPTDKDPMPDPCFKIDLFLKTQPQSSHPFLEKTLKTQAFQRFVEERTFPSKDNSHVLYFDESIVAKMNRSRLQSKRTTPFLDDKSGEITQTFTAPTPDPTGLKPGEEVHYQVWPKLDARLYTKSRLSSTAAPEPRKTKVVEDLASHEQSVHTIWFMIWQAIMLKINSMSADKHTAEKGLDLAFQVLQSMRKSDITPEDEVFTLLMQVCAVSKQPDKALKVLQEMQNAGYRPDQSSFGALVQLLAQPKNGEGAPTGPATTPAGTAKPPVVVVPQSILAAVNELKRNWSSPQKPAGDVLLAAKRLVMPGPKPVHKTPRTTDRFLRYFEHTFPGLTINTNETCPSCNRNTIYDHDIRDGWTNNPNDYTTCCPKCKERFVARFKVQPSESAFRSLDLDDKDNKNVIYCEYLSPAVLKKEVRHLLATGQVERLCTADFRHSSPAIFWNLTWHLTNYLLPIDFLLMQFPGGASASAGAGAGDKNAPAQAAGAAAGGANGGQPAAARPASGSAGAAAGGVAAPRTEAKASNPQPQAQQQPQPQLAAPAAATAGPRLSNASQPGAPAGGNGGPST